MYGPGTGFTFNPVVGCLPGCAGRDTWCYARKMAKRFKHRCNLCYKFIPHLHPERLDEPMKRKKPAGIFVGSMADMFSPTTGSEWREAIYSVIEDTPQHVYFILTKRPQDVPSYELEIIGNLSNLWLGVSVTGDGDRQRLDVVGEHWPKSNRYFLSYEPFIKRLTGIPAYGPFSWYIMGRMTGQKAVVANWIDITHVYLDLLEWQRPIFVKDNLKALFPHRDWSQEFPDFGGATE